MHKIILCFLVFVISCTVGPDYHQKDAFEDTQVAQNLQLRGTSLKISKKWYEDFNDENLNSLIAEALNQNTDIASAVGKLKQARLFLKIAKAQYLPMLNVQGGYDYMKSSKNIGLASDTDYFSLGFDSNWEIDIWGKGRRLNEQKTAEVQKAYYSLQNVKNILTAEVAAAYFALKTLEEKYRISLHNLSLQKDIFNSIKEKYEAGLSDESSYHQSLYLLEKTKALIPSLEKQMKTTSNALAVLTGRLADTFENTSEKAKSATKKIYTYNLNNLFELPTDIIRTRPDVKEAEKDMEAQNAAIGQAVAALYPNLSLSALFGFQANNVSDLIKSSSRFYGYEPSSVLPIFHWGELQNTIDLEKEKMAEAYQNYKQTILSSVQELANAIISVRKEYQANKSYQNAAYNMQKAYQAMKEKYENGLIEYAALLEVQQDLLEAQNNLADSNGQIIQKIIAFYKATGGGYNE